ncbi:MAG: helix-turn-helix transcriptional regulator [Cetobacterium sp.]|uniref:helix-turn-helix transcriptional regulator n=1 Tax=Cetobacterium sp. TaxID=2071632 RepID=UPI003F2E1934
MKKLEDFFKQEDNEGIDLRYYFINELLDYRKQYNLTQNEFAKKIGLKQQAIARFEKGEIDPRLSFIFKILKGIAKKIKLENIRYESVGTFNSISSDREKLEFENTIFKKAC